MKVTILVQLAPDFFRQIFRINFFHLHLIFKEGQQRLCLPLPRRIAVPGNILHFFLCGNIVCLIPLVILQCLILVIMQPPSEDDTAIMHNTQRIKVIKRLNRFYHFLPAKLPELSVKAVELSDWYGTVIIFDHIKAVQKPYMLPPSMMEFRRVYFLKDFHNICRNKELVCILCRCCIVLFTKKCHIISIFEGNRFKYASIFDGLPEGLRLTVIHRKKPFLHTFLLEQTVRTSFCEHHRGETFPVILPEHRKELPGQIRTDSDFLRKVSQIFLSIN